MHDPVRAASAAPAADGLGAVDAPTVTQSAPTATTPVRIRTGPLLLVGAPGSESDTRRFLRGLFRKSGFIPGRVHVRPLGWRGPDTASFQFFFDVPKGRMEGVMMSVARGRLRGTLMVIGLANAIEPADVWRLRGKVRARIASTGGS